MAGIAGVDVLNATNGSLIQHIDTTSFGLNDLIGFIFLTNVD